MADYSFDIVSKVEQQELANALNAAHKELANRFDFKASHLVVELEKDTILLESADEMKMKQLIDVAQSKMLKRGLDLKAFAFNVAPFEKNLSGIVKHKVAVQQGLNQEQCKKITKLIKNSRLKVQSRIQENSVRVSGKSKDDLQEIQKKVQEAGFDFACSFENYR